MSRLKYGKETIDAFFKQKARVEGWSKEARAKREEEAEKAKFYNIFRGLK